MLVLHILRAVLLNWNYEMQLWQDNLITRFYIQMGQLPFELGSGTDGILKSCKVGY